MKMFDVQGVHLKVTPDKAFTYISDPARLPEWTNAFASATHDKAVMCTPAGEVEIGLTVRTSEDQGTIDWLMTFPDGNIAAAYSRIVKLDLKSCIYTFVLTPPPVPLEQLEGALEAQSYILAEELQKLKTILENHA